MHRLAALQELSVLQLFASIPSTPCTSYIMWTKTPLSAHVHSCMWHKVRGVGSQSCSYPRALPCATCHNTLKRTQYHTSELTSLEIQYITASVHYLHKIRARNSQATFYAHINYFFICGCRCICIAIGKCISIAFFFLWLFCNTLTFLAAIHLLLCFH